MTNNKMNDQMKKQKHSYSYLRRLTGEPDAREYGCIVRMLQEEGVELYVEDGNGEYRLADEPAGAVVYTGNGALYVTAADAEYARDAAEHAIRSLYPDGAEADRAVKRSLREIMQETGPEDEATKAAREYIRRQKATYLQWAIVIVVMMVFMIVRAWIG